RCGWDAESRSRWQVDQHSLGAPLKRFRRDGPARETVPGPDQRRRKLLENSFVVPDAALADVPASLRAPAEPSRGAAGAGGNGSGPRIPPQVAAPARPRQAEAAPSRQGSGARSARLQACFVMVPGATSEKERNPETATMVPQLPDADADAPSVPATARDVVGRR